MKNLALRGGLALALVACSISLALAQTITAPPATTVNVGNAWAAWAPAIEEVLGVIVTCIIGWALKKFTDKTHIDVEAKHRDALHSAAMTGVHLAISKLGGMLSNVSIDTRSAIIAQGVDWVLASVPDALTYLGVTKGSVEQLVESKLNAVLIGNATAAAAPATGG